MLSQQPEQAQPSVSHFLVVIDAAHGGDDRGCDLGDNRDEKIVTLELARRLRAQLAMRGISATLLRDSDTALSLEARAMAANAAHPSLYLALHAASPPGIRVFSDLLSASVYGEPTGTFRQWSQAQQSFLARSQEAAAALGQKLEEQQPVMLLAAPLRPLNNIAAPAVAIEIGMQKEGAGVITSAEEQKLSKQIAQAIIAARRALEHAQ